MAKALKYFAQDSLPGRKPCRARAHRWRRFEREDHRGMLLYFERCRACGAIHDIHRWKPDPETDNG